MGGVIICISITCTWRIGISLITEHQGIQLPLIATLGPVFMWIMFFALGCFLGQNQDKSFPLKYLIIGCLLALTLRYLSQRWIGSSISLALLSSTFSSLFSFFLIMVLFSPKFKSIFKETSFTKPICLLGDLSFGIYLSHMFVLLIVNKAFSILPIETHPSFVWVVVWLTTLIVDSMVILILRQFFSKKHLALIGV